VSAETISGADPLFVTVSVCDALATPCGCVPEKVIVLVLSSAVGTA
jgi:hypothetical protein